MGDYLHSIWRARHFWLSLVAMDLQTRYRRSVLGIGWSLLQPIVLTVILHCVFGRMFQDQIEHYALFVLAGLVCWNFFTNVTQQGSHCFLVAEGYIRQHPSPLAIYPLRVTLGGSVHFLLALSVVLVATALLQGFAHPLALLSLIPALLLVFVFGWC
ncbi:MAG: ABC transporter permease, partial [Planctomycetia bacterium]|nr:ABC transporter permease [Planctomycetia bacterium]